MAFDLGSIASKLTISLNQFMAGLQQAVSQGRLTQQTLQDVLQTNLKIDITPAQETLGQIVSTAKQSVAEIQETLTGFEQQLQEMPGRVPQLELEFDVADAEQTAFGFMRNLEMIQKETRQTGEAATEVEKPSKKLWEMLINYASTFIERLKEIPGLSRIIQSVLTGMGLAGSASMVRMGSAVGLVVVGLLLLLRTARAIFATLQDGAGRVSNDLQVMRTRATDAWNATIRVAAIPFFEGLDRLLKAITRDLNEHGAIWAATTIVLTGVARIIKGVLVIFADIITAVLRVKKVFDDWFDSVERVEQRMRGFLGETLSRVLIGPPLRELYTFRAPEPPGVGRPTRDIERDIERGRDALAAQAQLSQEVLDTEEQRARVLVESARARGDEIGATQLQRQMELGLLALQREQNLNRMEAVQRQRQLLEELEPGISAQKRSQDEAKRLLETEMEILAIQTDRVEMAEREARLRGDLAISLQRIAVIERQMAMSQQERTAQAGLQIAQLEEQRASELEIIGVRKTAEGLSLLNDERRLRQALAIAEKQFGLNALVTEEIRSRLRINRALADTLDITTQIELRRAKALHELELERLTGERIQQVYERQIQSQRIADERRQLAIQGRALTPERESMALGRARIQADQDALDLRRQQLAADVKSLEVQRQKAVAAAQTEEEELRVNAAYRNRTQALQDQIALIGEQSDLLRDQARFIEETPLRRRIQDMTAALVQGFSNFQDQLRQGAVDIGNVLRDVGFSLVQTSLRPMLEELMNYVSRYLSQIASGLGRFAALIPGIVGVALVAVGSLFDRQKAEVEALGESVKDNIEQVERVRGLVAGETTIAIAKINESLKEAMRETNTILREHTNYLRQIASQAGVALAPSTQPGVSISAELLGSQRAF